MSFWGGFWGLLGMAVTMVELWLGRRLWAAQAEAELAELEALGDEYRARLARETQCTR